MLVIRRAAVLGAGRMGTAVAAHLANAGIPTQLLDLAPTELNEEEQGKKLTLESKAVRNRLAEVAIATAAKGRPAAFAHASRMSLLTPGNFDDDLPSLADVDWVIEAVVERLDIKKDLLIRVAKHVGANTIVSTNSSGLSVNAMAAVLPKDLKTRFLGTHFFFPPRYMYLLELIPGAETDPNVVAALGDFAELRLGKGVVLSNDRPNFVANRVGMFSTLYAMHIMDKYGLTIEEVDAASGRALARSVTATYGTSDLAGTDTLSYAVASHYQVAVDDEMREHWKMPQWILDMLVKGFVGDKAGSGFYKEKRTQTFDPATMDYRPRQEPRQSSIVEANKISDPAERVRKFVSRDDDAARFGWDLLAATFVYSANRIPEICADIAQIDRGMRWGYAWDLGPFELWDSLGVKETVARMQAEGRAVPDWVAALAESDEPRFYKQDGASVAAFGPEKRYVPLAPRPRTIVLDDLKRAGKTLDECPAASLIDLGDRVVCLEYHTRGNTVTEEVHQFTEKILTAAGRDYDALVIGNQGSHFSGGADLKMMADRIRAGEFVAIDATLRYVQKVTMALKYSPIPVVAAPFGRVLGGGVEVCLHCDRIQAEANVSMGLVETSVGLIPGAGGIKESLLRAMAVLKGVSWPFPYLMPVFDAIVQAKTTGSAYEAFDLNYMRPGDGVTMNKEGVIYAAKRTALQMLDTGYQPPVPAKVKVMGVDGIGNFRCVSYNMVQGQFISEHDRYLGEKVAYVLSGGEVDPGTEVDEWHLLHLERTAFLEICHTPKTLERIQAMLDTGKPLRN
jgi:3-hydroxyacyl-CoA dehydrogenase